MKHLLVILISISNILFAEENSVTLEKKPFQILGSSSQYYIERAECNATLIMDGDGQEYLFIDGSWYKIRIIEKVFPIRYGD